MPDEFEGERSILPGLMGLGAGATVAGYQGLFSQFGDVIGRGMQDTDPLSQVVRGRGAMAGYSADISTIDPRLRDPILQAFRRRVGKQTGLGAVSSLESAMQATKGFPALQAILKQSIEEFARVDPSQIGAPIATGGLRNIPVTLTGPVSIANEEAVSRALSRNELGLSGVQRRALRTHLQELAAVSQEMMDKTPTFQMRMVGDKATSEMLINVHRAGGPVTMAVPLPSATGAVATEAGTRYYARKVLADPARFLTTGVAEEAYAGEYSVQRLKQLITEQQGAISQRQVSTLQREIRKQLIYTGEERGLLGGAAGRTYGRQMVIPRVRGQEALYRNVMNRLAEQGRAVGLTPDALSKGVMWTEEGAARIPGVLTPQHYGQAMTKGRFVGGAGAVNLFQVSPGALETAGQQLGLGVITPQQDVIMMSNLQRAEMRATIRRSITIDPNLAASRRFERIQQLLADNASTRSMLKGGATIEETMAAYMAQAGRAQYQEMAGLRFLKEGEFLGFTETGPEFAKTYGTKTMIRDFRTVGGMTEITTTGQYAAQKVFSVGGVKHQLEYADPEQIRRLGVRAKALELLKMRGVDPVTLDVSTAAGATALRKAEIEAGKLYGTAAGIIVEGVGMKPWEKIYGAGKNVGRFNQMIEEKWRGMGFEMPTGYYETEDLMQRRAILGKELQRRGISWRETFNPALMAQRAEFLQPGPAAEMLGIGRPGTFTDDAFRVFKAYGWTSIAEDMAARVERDVPLQELLEGAARATRGEGVAVPLEEIMGRAGGIEALLADAGERARFIAEEGGVIKLPQAYRVAGKEISQIAIPQMGTGYTGYFTTIEGREIMRDLDRSLREVLTMAGADIGAAGIAPGELAAAGALEEYYSQLATMAVKQRDKYGGVVRGSKTFAIGRELLPDEAMVAIGGGAEAAVPTARFHPETFENWVAENLQAGMVDRSMAREQRRLFYQGKLPMKAIKHPARGPLSTSLFFAGPTPGRVAGWEAERNIMYLSKSLLAPFMADLDFDPLPVDMFTTRGAMAEATTALESGQISGLLAKHEQIRTEIVGRGIKESRKGIPAFTAGKPNLEFLKETSARNAAAKTKVGVFTTRLGWPMMAAAEKAGMGLEDMFKASFWAEIMEEATTLKARQDLGMTAEVAEELAYAFQTGHHDVLQKKTREILALRKGEEGYFDDVLERVTSTWKNLGTSERELYEAQFAGKGRANAQTFMRLAASESLAAGTTGGRATSGVAANISKVFGGLGNVMRGHKKKIVMALAASTAAAMLFSRPKDLTPEAVESGKVSGGPHQPATRLPMPRLEKGLFYKEGSRPGYRINLNLSKEIDHKALSRQLSQIAGQRPVNVHINDARKRITRHDIEREMRMDRSIGATRGFYNSSRYQ